MAGDTTITVVGNLVADPELRFTPNGVAVCSFTVASTPRQFDKNTNQWKDGEPLFLRCNVWRQAAENVANSFSKGSRVIVVGNLVQRSWEDKDGGGKRSAFELQVDDIGASAKFRTVTINQAERSHSAPPPAEDPWGSAPPPPPQTQRPAQQPDPWGSAPARQSYLDDPPF
jgi:single-strand DNA-binding protein